MAKAPIAGAVKTRLCPPFDHDQAASLAAAFAVATWSSACSLPGAHVLLARAGSAEDFPGVLANAPSFDQHGGDLGARIEHAAREALAHAQSAIVIGSDIPGLPRGHLESARAALRDHDAVLGPSRDGGFYLIGLHRCDVGLLADLPWSAPTTREACHERLVQRGYTVAVIEPFEDVDDVHAVRRLHAAINAGHVRAPATAAVLSRLPWT